MSSSWNGRWPVGHMVGGEWQLVGVLGQGGMGAVYRARSRRSGQDAALKVLAGAGSPAQRERLRREAAVTARLDHPGIVRLLGHGEERGTPYLVYELIAGQPLEGLLERLDRRTAVGIVREVALALGHAHARGVVHRDVKPGNVLVQPDGRPRLLDFGLGWTQDAERLTRTGALLGTPLYMAPEQAFEPQRVGPPADVWSLGVILYQLLTRQLPFSGETVVELLRRVREGAFTPPRRLDPTIPAALEQVCLRALSADPDRRPRDGTALAHELGAWLATGSPAPSSAPSGARPDTARPARAGPIVALLLACGTGAVGAGWLASRGARGTSAVPAPPAPPANPPAPTPPPAPPPSAHDLALAQAAEALSRGDPGQALRLLADGPDDQVRTWFMRGMAQRELEQNDRALVSFDEALRLAPDDLDVLVGRGHLQILRGALDEARADLTRATQVAPDDAQAWHYLGLACLEGDDLESARAAHDRALALRPAHAASWVNRGTVRAREGDFAGAVEDYSRGLELAPDHRDALEWRGRCLGHLGRWQEALADQDRALALGGDNPGLRADRAQAWEQLGRPDLGARELDRALEMTPDVPELWLRRGLLRGNAGDAAGSLADLERWQARNPPRPEVWAGRGVALGQLGRREEAEAAYGQALALDPQNATALNNRGLLRLTSGRASEALADFEQLARAQPRLPQAWNNGAAALLALGREEEARDAAERSLALAPEYPSALRNRGLARARLGDREGARADLSRALSLVGPDDPIAADLRLTLEQLGGR